METGTVNASDNSLDFNSFSFKAIVPVGALLHQLGSGVMTYLETHGITEAELAIAAMELTLMTTRPIDDLDRIYEYLYPRVTSHIEEQEYNGRNIDYETFIAHYNHAVFAVYKHTYAFYRSVAVAKGIENVRTPVLTRQEWSFHGDDILLEINVEDADK
jgi:hypothetical protein